MKRVLIVDDEQDHRLVLGALLQSHGYVCDEAEDGIMAIKKLLIESFDLIVTDFNMPRMDGLQLIEYMADHPSLRRLPVILVTSVIPKMNTTNGAKGNMKDVLPKPYDSQKLLAAVAKASNETICEVSLSG